MKTICSLLFFIGSLAALGATFDAWRLAQPDTDIARSYSLWIAPGPVTNQVVTVATNVVPREAVLASVETRYIVALSNLHLSVGVDDATIQAAVTNQFVASSSVSNVSYSSKSGISILYLEKVIVAHGGDPLQATGYTMATNISVTVSNQCAPSLQEQNQ